MKKTDKLLLGLICLSMAVVTVNSIPITVFSINNEAYSDSDILAAETIAVENETYDVFPLTLEFETESGMKITLEQFVNLLDSDTNETVVIKLDDQEMTLDKTIKAGETWMYAKIANFVIIPEETALIDPVKTSYYPSSKELVINLESPTNKLYVYTSKKGAPSIVIPSVSASWSYSPDNKMIEIEGKNGLTGETIIYWVGFLRDDGTIFIEDTKTSDVLENSIKKMNIENKVIQGYIEANQSLLDELELSSDELDLQAEKLTIEINELEDNITEMNEEKTEMENRITGNVALSTPIVIIWAILFGALIILLLNAFIFRRSEEK